MSNLNALRDRLIALRAEQLKAKAESDKAIETIHNLVEGMDKDLDQAIRKLSSELEKIVDV